MRVSTPPTPTETKENLAFFSQTFNHTEILGLQLLEGVSERGYVRVLSKSKYKAIIKGVKSLLRLCLFEAKIHTKECIKGHNNRHNNSEKNKIKKLSDVLPTDIMKLLNN